MNPKATLAVLSNHLATVIFLMFVATVAQVRAQASQSSTEYARIEYEDAPLNTRRLSKYEADGQLERFEKQLRRRELERSLAGMHRRARDSTS